MVKGNINDILTEVGGVGRYQIFVFFWSFMAGLMWAMQSMVMVLAQGNMDYSCTDEGMLHVNGTSSQDDSCFLSSSKDIKCRSFNYSSIYFKDTVVSEFGLVCDRAYLITLSNMLFMAARIPGGLISGQTIDRLGRKKAMMLSFFFLGAIGIALAYSVNMEMYIALKCLHTIPILASYDAPATLLSEITAPKRRAAILIGLIFSWGTGIMLLSGIGYWLRYWRDLQLAISIPPFLLAVIAYWAFDESPHWLFSQGKYKEAQEVIDKMANWNGMNLVNKQVEYYKDVDEEPSTSSDSLATLFKSFKVRRILVVLLICAIGWLSCNMAYTGLAMGITDLIGDIYLNNTIGGATELISYVITFLVLPGGRKHVYIPLLIVGGGGLIANAIISVTLPGLSWLIILTTMIGRLSVSACWQILYIWCLELFPTTLRMSMLQASMISGHIGSTTAPLINKLHEMIDKDSPVKGELIAPIVYGLMLIATALLSFRLPETNNKSLPVTIHDTGSYDSLTSKTNESKSDIMELALPK